MNMDRIQESDESELIPLLGTNRRPFLRPCTLALSLFEHEDAERNGVHLQAAIPECRALHK
jgi:hypothetical protein